MICTYIKLINCDNIIAMTDDGEDYVDKKYIEVHSPIVITAMRFPRGQVIIETFHMEPWIKFVDTKLLRIPVRNVLVMIPVDNKTEGHYNRYLVESKKAEENEPDLDQLELEEDRDEEEILEYVNLMEKLKNDPPTFH